MTKLIALLKTLAENCFYGKVIIGFQNGKITFLETRKTEDISKFN